MATCPINRQTVTKGLTEKIGQQLIDSGKFNQDLTPIQPAEYFTREVEGETIYYKREQGKDRAKSISEQEYNNRTEDIQLGEAEAVVQSINDAYGYPVVNEDFSITIPDELVNEYETRLSSQKEALREELLNSEGQLLVEPYEVNEIKKSYKTKGKYSDSLRRVLEKGSKLNFTDLVSNFGEDSDYVWSLIQDRTVSNSFKESGYVNFNGTKITSPADLADLYQIHRSPLIEKFHVAYLKEGEIVHTSAVTAGRVNASSIVDPVLAAQTANDLGADSIAILHNHPSGDPGPSQADIYITDLYEEALFDHGVEFFGHVVIDTDKFSLIKGSQVTSHSYKAQPLTTTRVNIGSGPEALNNLMSLSKKILTNEDTDVGVFYLNPRFDIVGYDILAPEDYNQGDVESIAKQIGASNYVTVTSNQEVFDNVRLTSKPSGVSSLDAMMVDGNKVTSAVMTNRNQEILKDTTSELIELWGLNSVSTEQAADVASSVGENTLNMGRAIYQALSDNTLGESFNTMKGYISKSIKVPEVGSVNFLNSLASSLEKYYTDNIVLDENVPKVDELLNNLFTQLSPQIEDGDIALSPALQEVYNYYASGEYNPEISEKTSFVSELGPQIPCAG